MNSNYKKEASFKNENLSKGQKVLLRRACALLQMAASFYLTELFKPFILPIFLFSIAVIVVIVLKTGKAKRLCALQVHVGQKICMNTISRKSIMCNRRLLSAILVGLSASSLLACFAPAVLAKTDTPTSEEYLLDQALESSNFREVAQIAVTARSKQRAAIVLSAVHASKNANVTARRKFKRKRYFYEVLICSSEANFGTTSNVSAAQPRESWQEIPQGHFVFFGTARPILWIVDADTAVAFFRQPQADYRVKNSEQAPLVDGGITCNGPCSQRSPNSEFLFAVDQTEY
jgi:cytochrome b